jgi:hypothetical protein
MHLSTFLAVTMATVVSMSANPAIAQSNSNTQVGMLKCAVQGGIGQIVRSSKKMTCRFERVDGPAENYVGRITKIGLDIGITKRSVIYWAVFAPSKMEDKGALAGIYRGISVEATVAAGVGANNLRGGDNAVTLQPISVSAQIGLNIAAGIGSIVLEPANP